MVEKLEACAAKKAAINDRWSKQDAEFGCRVDSAGPSAGAEVVEIFRMLAHEQCLGFAVTMLLFEVVVNRRAAVMPHKSGRIKADFVTGLLKTPADVHVIACAAENWIKAAHAGEDPFIDGHVATGDVLSLAVGQHDMSGTARRNHYRRCNQ